MSPAMHLPPAPEAPVTELPRERIRELAHVYGHLRRVAGDRFAALLPIVFRDRIYEDDGCLSGYEWAAKKAGMSKEEVDRILVLWGRMGHHACLWRLLGEDVGISKLERVAPHVTRENAEAMARLVEKLTCPELQKWLASQRKPDAAGTSGRMAGHESEMAAGAQAKLSFVSGFMGAAGEQAVAALPAGPDSAACTSPEGHPATPPFAGDTLPASFPAEPPGAIAAPSAGADAIVKNSGECQLEIAEPVPPSLSAVTCRLSLEVDAIDEKRIRQLQDLYQRLHGRRIGVGQLYGLLVRWALARAELPSLEDLAGCRIEPGERPATSWTDASLAAAPPSVVSTRATGALADAGGTEVAVDDSGPAADDAAPVTPASGLPGKRFAPKLLEVVVSVAETGWKFTRTAIGWIPIPDGALTGFLSPAIAVPLSNLRLVAVAATQKAAGGRHRPAAVDRYLLARSGGYCEIRTCKGRATAAHHRKRFSFDPSHHPDDLICVCEPHHGLPHAGEIVDERLDPQAWTVLQADQEPDERTVDFQFKACRQAAIGRPAREDGSPGESRPG